MWQSKNLIIKVWAWRAILLGRSRRYTALQGNPPVVNMLGFDVENNSIHLEVAAFSLKTHIEEYNS
jgi:hypothetical protein